MNTPAFEENLTKVLRSCFDNFDALHAVDRLSGGASQETYKIEFAEGETVRTVAMRRAPGGEYVNPDPARPGLATEARLMQIAREVGVPEPEVYRVLTREDDLGAGFIMEWLDGETLGSRILKSPELEGIRPRLARECGQILARIHSIDPVESGLTKLLTTVTTEAFIRKMWEQYQSYDTPQPMIDYTARWLLEHMPPEGEARLVHNDFRNGNLMVTPDGINAVLDWEVAHLGDPVRDIGWICTNSWRFGRTELRVGGFGHLQDLLDGYEDESGIRIDPEHVHFWEVFGSFWWAVGCLKMADNWRNGPDRTVERPGVARRSSECQADCVNLLIPGAVQLVEEVEPLSSVDTPRVDELLISVRDFLREDMRAATQGRDNFMALVASNSLDIVLREMRLSSQCLQAEADRLERLLGSEGEVMALRWKLTSALRDGDIELDLPGLAAHLRATVINQLAIDQPRYSALATALANEL
jgi:aminoglycoside phosphotransferase (APT) family kinase protein